MVVLGTLLAPSLAVSQTIPIPTPAPLAKSGAAPSIPPASPQIQSAPTNAKPLVAGGPQTREDALEGVARRFAAIKTMVANFEQTSPDGQVSRGVLTMQRPGRLRFDYAAPSPLDIVADGRSVAIRNTKLKTQDLYPIGQTPLRFLLREKLNLEKDSKVNAVRLEGSNVVIVLEESGTIGGNTLLTLVFNAQTYDLEEWLVKDPQGYETQVRLLNVDYAQKPDLTTFSIDYARPLSTK
jgi:outer membrane lipoprotein-sorting protein